MYFASYIERHCSSKGLLGSVMLPNSSKKHTKNVKRQFRKPATHHGNPLSGENNVQSEQAHR